MTSRVLSRITPTNVLTYKWLRSSGVPRSVPPAPYSFTVGPACPSNLFMKKVYYRKLVRDGIPDKIEGKGEACEYRVMGTEEFINELFCKVQEEASEIVKEKSSEELVGELVSLQLVLEAVREVRGISDKDFKVAYERGVERMGKFDKQIYLEWSEDKGTYQADIQYETTDGDPLFHAVDLGRYRHYKGGMYDVLGTARHSESRQGLVIYREADKAEPKTWARSLRMFLGQVEVDGKMMPRFTKLD